MHYPCLAKRAMLKFSKFRKPRPPLVFHNAQFILFLSFYWPYRKLTMVELMVRWLGYKTLTFPSQDFIEDALF